MSYVPRTYEDAVRDLLTTLTGGTVRETIAVPQGDGPLTLEKLRHRPVTRISHLQGQIAVGTGEDVREIPYRFTAADFELVSSAGDGQKDAIRFREGGRRPVPGSTLVVNYYPVQTDPVPLTDLNVGSVTRTLVESFAREMALAYLHLEQVYESAFLDTAEGSSLDRVVALVGLRRLAAGHPVVRVLFSRQAGMPGRITVPAGTPLTDADGNRYLTLTALTMEPNEMSGEVLAGGETSGTAPVEQGALDRLEVLIAGISSVANPQPARQLGAPETDEALRLRARNALHGVVRGTVDALRFGLLSIPGVKDAAIVEAPNGVPGEIQIQVAYGDDSPEVRAAVARAIDELRPAGIRVLSAEAARLRLNVRADLTLAVPAGSLSAPEIASLTHGVEERLAAYLSGISPGGTVRRAKLLALVLQDERIADASVSLLPQGAPAAEELSLDSGQVLELIRPFTFAPPTYEGQPGAAPAVTSTASLSLPIRLVAGVTQAEAQDAINRALDGFLATRGPEAPVTVDRLVAHIRDDTRYAVVRQDVLLTMETYDRRFRQLTDGVGEYLVAANEKLTKGAVDLEVREGMV
jgi:uncharacterized phage protein gp47/JayE